MKYFQFKKVIDQYIEKDIYRENTGDTNPHHVQGNLDVRGCCLCDSQAVAGASKLMDIRCRRDLVKYLLYETVVLMYYEIFSRYGSSHSAETHLTPLKSVRNYLLTSATSHLNFAYERNVTSSGHEGTPAWKKAKPSSSRRSHRKTYRPAEARIYHRCVELVISIGKDSEHLKFSFSKHTAWSTSLSPREADGACLAQFDFTRSVSRKNWHAHFHDRGWRRLRYLPPR